MSKNQTASFYKAALGFRSNVAALKFGYFPMRFFVDFSENLGLGAVSEEILKNQYFGAKMVEIGCDNRTS